MKRFSGVGSLCKYCEMMESRSDWRGLMNQRCVLIRMNTNRGRRKGDRAMVAECHLSAANAMEKNRSNQRQIKRFFGPGRKNEELFLLLFDFHSERLTIDIFFLCTARRSGPFGHQDSCRYESIC